MIRVLICFFAITFSTLLYGQKEREVVIEGKATFASNSKIRITTFSDYITWQPQETAVGKIDKNGDFKLSFKLKQISLVQISILRSKAEFFVSPGYSYNFQIDMDSLGHQSFDPTIQNQYLKISVTEIDTNDINLKINHFNNRLDEILAPYAYDIMRYNDVTAFDSVCAQVAQEFPILHNPDNYYHSYIFYSLANIERIIYKKSPKKIYAKYLDNDYILYNNPAYMDFFNGFYDNYLYNSPRIKKSDLEQNINIEPNYNALFNAIGKDFLLVNERLREFVIIKNLGQFLGNEEFDAGNILKLLEHIETTTHFPDHKTFIFNIIQKYKKENFRLETPNFIFKTPKGSDFRFSKLNGKPVYVQVFRTDCPDCIREMKLIEELKKTYDEKIEFVSISVDYDITKFEKFRLSYPEFDWTFVHFNDQYNWMDYFEINSLPEYYLLSEDGNMMQRYAPAPTKGLSQYLQMHFYEEEDIPENPMFQQRN